MRYWRRKKHRPRRDGEPESHVRRRFYERVGVILTDELHRRLIDDIRAGRGKCLERQSEAISVWEVEVSGQQVAVVYDRRHHVLRTVMTRNPVLAGLVSPEKRHDYGPGAIL